jgi:hypothetical protein
MTGSDRLALKRTALHGGGRDSDFNLVRFCALTRVVVSDYTIYSCHYKRFGRTKPNSLIKSSTTSHLALTYESPARGASTVVIRTLLKVDARSTPPSRW